MDSAMVRRSSMIVSKCSDRNGERKAASASTSGGDGVILFGVPCEYPMSGGSSSLAILVGLSTKYMGEVLFLDSCFAMLACSASFRAASISVFIRFNWDTWSLNSFKYRKNM